MTSEREVRPLCSFVADVHVGNHRTLGGTMRGGLNERARLALDALREAARGAAERGEAALFVLGDLLDVSRPEPAVLAETQRVLAEARAAGVEPVLLLGNHEMRSGEPGDHALAPLRPVATVVEEPTVVVVRGELRVLCVPHLRGDGAAERFAEAARGLDGVDPKHYVVVGGGSGAEGDRGGKPSPNSSRSSFTSYLHRDRLPSALAFHAGIFDDASPAFLRSADGALDARTVLDLLDELGAAFGLCGDFHAERQWRRGGRGLVQVGALCPSGFGDEGAGGRVASLAVTRDGELALELRRVRAPRFVTFDARAERAADARARVGAEKPHAEVSATFARIVAEDEAEAAAFAEALDLPGLRWTFVRGSAEGERAGEGARRGGGEGAEESAGARAGAERLEAFVSEAARAEAENEGLEAEPVERLALRALAEARGEGAGGDDAVASR